MVLSLTGWYPAARPRPIEPSLPHSEPSRPPTLNYVLDNYTKYYHSLRLEWVLPVWLYLKVLESCQFFLWHRYVYLKFCLNKGEISADNI